MTLVLLLLGMFPAISDGSTGWTQPFRVAGPLQQDLQPPQVATLAPRSVVIGSGSADIDAPGSAQATVILRGQRGGFFPPHLLRGIQQVLALALGGEGFTLLSGSAEAGQPCCSAVTAISSTTPRRRLISGLDGLTQARLLRVGGRLLAAIATDRGVWVTQTAKRGGFGPVRRLSASTEYPQNLAVAPLSGNRSLVAWTAREDGITAPGPSTIFEAEGSPGGRPVRGRVALSVAPGHEIDELALVGAPGEPLLVWVESWFDSGGAFHSEVRAAAPGSRSEPMRLSTPGQLAASLTASSGGRGGELAGFSECDPGSGGCTAAAVVRLGAEGFGRVQRLGDVDGGQPMSSAVTGDGRAVLGWISGGHVLAAAAATARGGRFGPVVQLSATNLASELALAPGPGPGAVAVWNQATFSQQVLAAFLR